MAKLFDTAQDRIKGIEAARSALERGELVGLPTETVYGLAADATNPKAVATIFAAKTRPRFNPLIIHVKSTEAARSLAELGEVGDRLAAAFWPGPLTLVAPRKPGSGIADLATAGLDTIALRVPGHPIAAELLAAVPFPLAAPSANLSGRVSATSAEHVLNDLGDQVAVILDAGPSPLGLESTIVAVGDEPTMLRPGAVPKEAIEAVIGRPLQIAGAAARPDAPGMLESHYAPSVPLRLDVGEVRPNESLLAFGPDLPVGADKAAATVNLSVRGDLSEAATRFFAALRDLDRVGAPIAAMPVPDEGLGLAINDRLRRAAEPRSG